MLRRANRAQLNRMFVLEFLLVSQRHPRPRPNARKSYAFAGNHVNQSPASAVKVFI
jgi:hypothetical protein